MNVGINSVCGSISREYPQEKKSKSSPSIPAPHFSPQLVQRQVTLPPNVKFANYTEDDLYQDEEPSAPASPKVFQKRSIIKSNSLPLRTHQQSTKLSQTPPPQKSQPWAISTRVKSATPPPHYPMILRKCSSDSLGNLKIRYDPLTTGSMIEDLAEKNSILEKKNEKLKREVRELTEQVGELKEHIQHLSRILEASTTNKLSREPVGISSYPPAGALKTKFQTRSTTTNTPLTHPQNPSSFKSVSQNVMPLEANQKIETEFDVSQFFSDCGYDRNAF